MLTVKLLERYGENAAEEAEFSRQFRKTIGDSPHQFLMRCRMERALGLLTDAGHPLSDIAIACGFSDQAHLTRLFKRFTGKTPRQYRAQAI